jgi:beta-lactamase regulating signal transducer with metallopeptidase domain/biopolymer transport protein ExbD
MNATLSLPDDLLLLAGGAAVGSIVFSAAGLLAARCARRSLPLRHGLLLVTVLMLLMLPAVLAGAARCGLGWRPPVIVDSAGAGDAGGSMTETAPIEPARPLEHIAAYEPRPSATGPSYVDRMSDDPDDFPHDPADDASSASRWDRSAPEQSPADVLPVIEPETGPVGTAVRTALDGAAIGSLALTIWMFGGCVSLGRSALAWSRLRQLRRRARPVTGATHLDALHDVVQASGLKRAPRLCAGDHIPVPFVHGLLQPAVILPFWLLAEPAAALRLVLIHEIAHIRRRDVLVGRLQCAVQSMYWWNPLVRRLNLQLADAREDLCDNHVLQQTGDRRGYARTLLDAATRIVRAPPLPAIGLFTRTQPPLSQRIDNLLQEHRPMSTTLGRVSWILLVAFAFFLGATSMFFVVVTASDAETVPTLDFPTFELVDVQQPMVWQSTESVAIDAATVNDVFPMADTQPPFTEQLAQASPPPVAFDSATPAINEPAGVTTAPPLNATLPQESGFAPSANPLDPAPIGPHDVDPFGTLPMPAVPAEPAPPVETQRGLIIVRLVGNEDGSLKELRYLTDDLGNDDAAFETLKQRVEEFSKEFAAAVAPQTEVQIVADPALRYEHVARVVAICEPFVNRVSFARAESEQQLTIAVGFVRDASGEKVIDQPVAFVGDKLVRIGELFDVLSAWRSENDLQFASGVTILIRADANVDYKMIEGLIREAQRAGFDRFSLKPLESLSARDGRSVLGVQITTDATVVHVSFGSHDGVRPGQRLFAYRQTDVASVSSDSDLRAVLEIVRVLDADISECRIVETNFTPEVGDPVVLAKYDVTQSLRTD